MHLKLQFFGAFGQNLFISLGDVAMEPGLGVLDLQNSKVMNFDFFTIFEVLIHFLKKNGNDIENLEAVKDVIELRMNVFLQSNFRNDWRFFSTHHTPDHDT